MNLMILGQITLQKARPREPMSPSKWRLDLLLNQCQRNNQTIIWSLKKVIKLSGSSVKDQRSLVQWTRRASKRRLHWTPKTSSRNFSNTLNEKTIPECWETSTRKKKTSSNNTQIYRTSTRANTPTRYKKTIDSTTLTTSCEALSQSTKLSSRFFFYT